MIYKQFLFWLRSASLLVPATALASEPALTLQTDNPLTQLWAGVELGIMVLLLLFTPLAAWAYRSMLLLLSGTGIWVQFLLSTLYRHEWQQLTTWHHGLVHWQPQLTSLVFFLLFGCIHLLLSLGRQPRYLPLLAWSYCLAGILLLLWQETQADLQWFTHYHNMFGIVLLLLVTLSFFHGVRPGPLFWLFGGVTTALLLSDQTSWPAGQLFPDYGPAFSLLFIAALLTNVHRQRRSQQTLEQQLTEKQQNSLDHLERTVAMRTRQLTRSLAARNQMLARISHDLRAPLGHIITRAGQTDAHNYKKESGYIMRTANRQLELLDDLIAYARGELQQQELTLESQYLYAFIKEIEEEGRLLARQHHNRFRLHIGEQLPVLIQADFRRLRRIIVNLLDNAAKFTHNGDISLSLTATALPGEQITLNVVVSDTGSGLSPSLQQRLDQPFLRGEHNKQGYGLGLAIVTELLAQMNSQLKTEQPAQGGSRFSFELKLDKGREYDVDQVFIDNRVQDLDGTGYQILLVDDIALTCTYLSELLGGYGFDTLIAHSAREALHYLEDGQVDLVITDQLMPDMNGWELLAQLREKHSHLPVLLYSALPPMPDSHHTHLHFNDTLLKPAGSDEFLHCVQHLCTQYQRL